MQSWNLQQQIARLAKQLNCTERGVIGEGEFANEWLESLERQFEALANQYFFLSEEREKLADLSQSLSLKNDLDDCRERLLTIILQRWEEFEQLPTSVYKRLFETSIVSEKVEELEGQRWSEEEVQYLKNLLGRFGLYKLAQVENKDKFAPKWLAYLERQFVLLANNYQSINKHAQSRLGFNEQWDSSFVLNQFKEIKKRLRKNILMRWDYFAQPAKEDTGRGLETEVMLEWTDELNQTIDLIKEKQAKQPDHSLSRWDLMRVKEVQKHLSFLMDLIKGFGIKK